MTRITVRDVIAQAKRDAYAARITCACLALVVVGLFVLLALAGCTAYNPAMYPSYDVLNPSESVRVNPLSTYPDPATGRQLYVVDSAFLAWVYELKAEVLKLRKGAR